MWSSPVASARAAAAAVAGALAVAAVLGAAPSARAEPTDLVRRPLVLSPGELEARLVIELGWSPGELAAPISFAPDAWYGVSRRWTLGVIHSHRSLGLIDDGAGLCAGGTAPYACDRAYRGGGFEARWSWREGPLAVAPTARLLVRDVDPWKPAITAGARVRWTRGRFAAISEPYLQLGLANRDRGNRAALVVPIWLAVQPARRWLVALRTGWDAQLATARDGWRGPVGLAAEVRASSCLSISLEAGFRTLLGPQHDLKDRALSLALSWRP